MSYKLAAINWDRDKKMLDERFIFRINQIRGQSNVLMVAATQGKGADVTAELFMRLHTRMHEVLFQNAPLIKRVYNQISSQDDWYAADGNDQEKLKILREVFSTHIAIRLCASRQVTNNSTMSKIAGDNLEELVSKCNALVEDS